MLDIRPILYYLDYNGPARSSFGAFTNPILCWGGLIGLFVLAFCALFRREKKALFLLLGVPCGVLLVREYLRFVFPGLGLRKAALPAWCGPAALALILLFWLLRNLPGFAFLAP